MRSSLLGVEQASLCRARRWHRQDLKIIVLRHHSVGSTDRSRTESTDADRQRSRKRAGYPNAPSSRCGPAGSPYSARGRWHRRPGQIAGPGPNSPVATTGPTGPGRAAASCPTAMGRTAASRFGRLTEVEQAASAGPSADESHLQKDAHRESPSGDSGRGRRRAPPLTAGCGLRSAVPVRAMVRAEPISPSTLSAGLVPVR